MSSTRLSAYIRIDGQEVRRRRLARRMNVAELADGAKIHKSHVYKIETCHHTRVRVETLRGLESVLGPLEGPPAEPAPAALADSAS